MQRNVSTMGYIRGRTENSNDGIYPVPEISLDSSF